MSSSERTVTAHIAVEAIVMGDMSKQAAAQYIMASLALANELHTDSDTVIYPRAMGLIRSDEREVNADEWGG